MNNVPLDAAQERTGAGRALIPAGGNQVSFANREQYYPLGLEISEEGNDFAKNLRQYMHILLKRKWLILSLALVFFVLGGVRAAMKTPLYSATARIQIDREPGKVIEGGATSPSEEGGTEFLRTQYEILKSRAMAERVVSALRIHEDEEYLRPYDASAFGLLTGSRKTSALSSSELQ